MKETKKVVNQYLSTYKFNEKFDSDNFVSMLSHVSYTFDNQEILENKDFLDLLNERAENLIDFGKNYRNSILFFSFCSV